MTRASYKGIELDCEGVYEPREDSFLLAEILGTKDLRNRKVLDMGCGSGILAIIAAKNGAKVTACDIKEKAVKATRRNAELNDVKIEIVVSDLFSGVSGKFDLIVFNPPYLPFDEYADTLQGAETWSAGKDLGIFKRFFAQAGMHLTSDGKILMVSSSLTGLQLKGIVTEHGYAFRTLSEKKVPWEILYVFEIFRKA